MIDQIVIPRDVNFAKRHEPTGALVGHRVTGIDDPREVSKAERQPKFGENRDFKRYPPTRGEKVLGYGALAAIPLSAAAGAKGGQALMRRSYRRRLESTVSGVPAALQRPAKGNIMEMFGKAAPPRQALKPLLGTGPLHKAPTLARSGGPGQPARNLLVRTARLGQPIRKALGPQTLEEAFKDVRGQRNALASAAERHVGARDSERKAARARNRKLAIGTGAGGLLVGTAGGRMSKAYRSFDPEDARQRRLGAMAAGSGLGGSALLASGGRQIARDSRKLGEHVRGARESVEVDHGRRQLLRLIGEDLPDKRAALVRLRPGAKVAGGAALLGGAGRLMSDRHKKPWR